MLLTYENAKTSKGEPLGYLTAILYLAPHKLADGKTNLCPKASKGCAESCLYTAGMGSFSNVQWARVNKTLAYINEPKGFEEQLIEEIGKAKIKANKLGLKLCVRLNGTSDILWEKKHPKIFEAHPDTQFYDYTKIPKRVTPSNYDLTFSRSESNHEECQRELQRGIRQSWVFEKMPNLDDTNRHIFVDGDIHDLRFLDPKGAIVCLKAKGQAKHDTSGFVIRKENY